MAEERVQRKLTTILTAGVVGYSRLSGRTKRALSRLSIPSSFVRLLGIQAMKPKYSTKTVHFVARRRDKPGQGETIQ